MPTKKQATKRGKAGIRPGQRALKGIPFVDVRSVEVTWCTAKGHLKRANLNLDEVGGFLWRYDPDKPLSKVLKVSRRPVPHVGRAHVIANDCTETFQFRSVPVACWWDPVRRTWECPPDLG
jgi:hypothetical protein